MKVVGYHVFVSLHERNLTTNNSISMKKCIICITAALLLLMGCAQNKTKMATIYDFKALNNKGEEVDMEADIEAMLK